MENILNIDNWIIVGLALLKIAYNFWPVVVVAAVMMWYTHLEETKLAKARIKQKKRVKNP